jgi:hypothetical protein
MLHSSAQKLLLGVLIHNAHLQMATIIRLLLFGCFVMYFHSKICNNSQTKSNLIKYCINKSYIKILIYFKLMKSNFIGLYHTEVLILWLLVAEAYTLYTLSVKNIMVIDYTNFKMYVTECLLCVSQLFVGFIIYFYSSWFIIVMFRLGDLQLIFEFPKKS